MTLKPKTLIVLYKRKYFTQDVESLKVGNGPADTYQWLYYKKQLVGCSFNILQDTLEDLIFHVMKKVLHKGIPVIYLK